MVQRVRIFIDNHYSPKPEYVRFYLILSIVFGFRIKPHVIIRTVGRTTASRNVRTLLRSVCLQMSHIFGSKAEEVPMVINERLIIHEY